MPESLTDPLYGLWALLRLNPCSTLEITTPASSSGKGETYIVTIEKIVPQPPWHKRARGTANGHTGTTTTITTIKI